MRRIDYEMGSEKKLEKFILILYTVYNFCMLFLTSTKEWERWISFVMAFCLALAWIVNIGQYRSYRFRVIFTTFAMQISLVVYAAQFDNIFEVLSLVCSYAFFIGFYGVADAMPITVVASVVLFFYHIVIAETMTFHDPETTIRNIFGMGNAFLVQYVVWGWVQKRNESNMRSEEAIEELQRAERSKDDFLANVSHEIRTPINTICGMSELILEEPDPKKIRENVLNIRSAGRNLMTVVSDILDFSELQSGKVELEEEAYDITTMITDVINMALAKKNEKQIELIVNCDANLPRVLYGDEKKIRRIMMNVLGNAIKFTKEGCVSLHVTSRKESYGINLVITIKDTGIGMKEESLEKLFTSFSQVDTKRNREEGGLGLGLAISRALAHKMGGVITVKSKYEKGTTVKIVIPQKVLDDNPVVTIRDKANLNVAVYINMEQFKMPEIRDEYANNIQSMIEQLHAKCRICRNLAELKSRYEQNHYSYIFISWAEYLEDTEYFNALAKETKVIIIIDAKDEQDIESPDICRIYKPFYILPIAAVINGDVEYVATGQRIRTDAFVAPKAHVLAVDDNEMNLLVIESLLEHYQVKVTKALSGKEALEKIETMDYDFVFMDHMMPEMDGVETLHRIRNKVGRYYRKVPVIALTANAIAGARERFIEEGFTDFLEKPIEVSVLERVLRRNLPEEKLLPVEMVKETKTPKETELVQSQSTQEVHEEHESQNTVELDTERGFLYCGGEDGYRKILTSYSRTGEENRQKIATLFDKGDWENYTISVHGIKSAMLSIGATRLSALAKELEAAGKRGDITYIKANHAEMMAEYGRVLQTVKNSPYVEVEEKKEKEQKEEETSTEKAVDESIAVKDLPELTEEAFDRYRSEMENAMFDLDGNRMITLLAELEGYRYGQVALKEQLSAVRRKIEMTDYMSAMDVLEKVWEHVRNSAGGGDTES